MTYDINVTPSMLRDSADAIETNANSIRHELDHIRTVLEPLRTTFIGLRASHIFDQVDVSSVEIDEWDDLMKVFAQQIRDIATRLEMADNA